MAVIKQDLNQTKSVYGTLARAHVTSPDIKQIYQASRHSKFVNVYFNITNVGTTPIEVTLYGHDAYNASTDDIIEKNISIDPNMTYVRGPVAISTGEWISVMVVGGEAVIRLYGFDERGG